MKLNGKFKTGLRPSYNLFASYIKCNIYKPIYFLMGIGLTHPKEFSGLDIRLFYIHYYKTRIFRVTLFSRAYIFGVYETTTILFSQ